MIRLAAGALAGRGAQLPLALLSFVCALGLAIAAALGRLDAGVALALAAAFATNGASRLWLRLRA